MRYLNASGVSAASTVLAVLALAPAVAQKIGDAPEATNMRLVGFHDLQARSAYQPTIHKQGERYIAYVGHHGASYVPNPMNAINGQASSTAPRSWTSPIRQSPNFSRIFPAPKAVRNPAVRR
jgi:hypothetical protein